MLIKIDNKVKGISLGMVSTCFWGAFYPVSRTLFGYDEGSLDALNFTVIRFSLAALFLAPLFLHRHNRELAVDLLRNHWRLVISLGLIGIVGEGLFVFWSLKYTTSARASLMANASPIFTLIISYFTGRELLTRSKALGMIIGFAGIVTAFLGQGGDIFASNSSTFAGDLMALLSGICWAYYTVFGDTVSKKYGGLLCCEIMFITGLLIMFPAALVKNRGLVLYLSKQAWIGVFYLGVLSYGLANSLWYVALTYVTPGELGSLGYVSAMLCIALSVIFLGEKINAQFICAFVLVLAGVALMLRSSPVNKSS